jgi:heme oxygenase
MVLREHTCVVHERLHRHSSFADLLSGALSHSEYRQLIRRLHGFYVTVDRAIDHAFTHRDDDQTIYRYAGRSEFLKQDLIDLGFDAEEIDEAPVCASASRIITPRSLGGVLYVIEGAMLGGTIIDRTMQKAFQPDQQGGRLYWSWCRLEGRTRWSATRQYLDHIVDRGASVDDLKQGASDIFHAMSEWLAPLDRFQTASVSERV